MGRARLRTAHTSRRINSCPSVRWPPLVRTVAPRARLQGPFAAQTDRFPRLPRCAAQPRAPSIYSTVPLPASSRHCRFRTATDECGAGTSWTPGRAEGPTATNGSFGN
jgi:hypothetical protein